MHKLAKLHDKRFWTFFNQDSINVSAVSKHGENAKGDYPYVCFYFCLFCLQGDAGQPDFLEMLMSNRG